MNTPAVFLRLGEGVPESTGRRIRHAFHNFCGVYGYKPVREPREAQVRLVYGSPAAGTDELELTASYATRQGARRREHPRSYLRVGLFQDPDGKTEFPCLHPLPQGGSPDWLGEIFEWLGGECEHLADSTDALGRVPFAETLPGLHGLDPRIPYAAIAMQGLNQDLGAFAGPGWPDGPRPPLGLEGLAVVATHDLDFLPLSPWNSLARGVKNAAIAAVLHRDSALVLQILRAVLGEVIRGRSPLDGLPLMEDQERSQGIQSSSYALCARRHRRDGNYRLDDWKVRQVLLRLAAAGMEIGVHGSYTSLDSPGLLAEEYAALRAAGFSVVGGRQHWLRYRPDTLFVELARAGAAYDCSVGYSERIGFRSGAAFPYVPWNFATETACPVLEIPLVIMDAALYSEFGGDFAAAEEQARRLLRQVARYSWGGVSLLWHNTAFGGAQLPTPIGDLYWSLKEPGHTWMTGAALVEAARQRFAPAGLGGSGE